MSYIYKDHEILARVHQTGSALYEIDKNGKITDEVEGLDIVHDDQQIVWYEVEVMNPETGLLDSGVEYKTLEDAKLAVRKSEEYLKDNENKD